MEAFALPGGGTIGSITLPPLVHKRLLSSANGSPVKRRKVSEPVSSPGSPMSTSSVGSTTPSSKSGASSRPNMTASSSITLDMLRPHFEEPLAKVAASFGICVTLLKKICRRHGIARWPHRQITGLRKSIASMEHAIGYFDGDRRESYAEQLLKQKNKLAALLEDPTTSNPLLASEEDENARTQPKVSSTHNAYEVSPASVTRASSPTGPLLAESPYYGASSAAVPSQTSPLWLPAANQVDSSYTQQYHQLCPPPKLQQYRPETYPTTSYCVPSAVPATGSGSSPAIYLPPLRRESRPVLPPISSLVVSGKSNNLASSMLTPSW
ncbi:hypothetical protein KRP22_007092 [Phytophthora ramorum]|nr:Protein NLP2 [Phytophthora ramorum]